MLYVVPTNSENQNKMKTVLKLLVLSFRIVDPAMIDDVNNSIKVR